MTTPINVIIGTESIIDDMTSCNLKYDTGAYCWSVDISISGKRIWDLCSPNRPDADELRVKVVIGDTTYSFMCEERTVSKNDMDGFEFSIWGRSKQAYLSVPFSSTITDTDDTGYLWQTTTMSAIDMVAYVADTFCSYGVTVTWDAEDYIINIGTLSVSGQSPLDIISALADVIGAELTGNIDGSLTINAFSAEAGTIVESYDEYDNIVSMGENSAITDGYNAVTVYGYDSEVSGSVSTSISVNKIEDESDEADNTIYVNHSFTVRVYWYHDSGVEIETYYPDGYVNYINSGIETITEDVQLVWGSGSTSLPNTNGETGVTGDEDIPLAIVTKAYDVNYRDYSLRANSIDEQHCMFYFVDESDSSIYSFTASEPSSEIDTDDVLAYISVEKESSDTIYAGEPATLKVLWSHGIGGDATHHYSIAGGSSGGNMAIAHLGGPIGSTGETITETVFLTYGVGNTSKPYNVYGETAVYGNENVPLSSVKMSYYVSYSLYAVSCSIPDEPCQALFYFGDNSASATYSFTASERIDPDPDPDTRVVTIRVADYVAETMIDGVSVSIDGSYVGTTDEYGELDVNNVLVGDHTIKMTKSGYQDSDTDELVNDEFTVS